MGPRGSPPIWRWSMRSPSPTLAQMGSSFGANAGAGGEMPAGRGPACDRDFEEALGLIQNAAMRYLQGLGEAGVCASARDRIPERPLAESGVGVEAALRELIHLSEGRSVSSGGPRYFHYVVGGTTPAALAGDWWTSTLDQLASSATGSPLAVELEILVTQWLAELVNLDPRAYTGVLVTGATVANFVGLGAARQWAGERHGIDVAEQGLAGVPQIRVLTSGFIHASAVKALAMLGIGRASIEKFSLDNRGTLDVAAMERRLEELRGEPVILVGTAGEVNAGRFDPLQELGRLKDEHGAWLHVDAAFGLFARAAPSARAWAEGLDAADSIASDAHKWLNVPYDSGFAFVAQRALLAKTFRLVADYLPPADGEPQRVPANLGPESSRRARALPIFASLAAYGRRGFERMFEGHLALATHLAAQIREAPDLELLDDPCLNIVPFRFAPQELRKRDWDAVNQEIYREVLEDGRVFVGTTRYRSVVCFRPAIANWRTEAADVELLVRVIRELGAQAVDRWTGPMKR